MLDSVRQWLDEPVVRIAAGDGAPKAKARLAAEDAVLRIQDALILSAGLDDPSPFCHVTERLPKDILG